MHLGGIGKEKNCSAMVAEKALPQIPVISHAITTVTSTSVRAVVAQETSYVPTLTSLSSLQAIKVSKGSSKLVKFNWQCQTILSVMGAARCLMQGSGDM